MFKTIYGVIYDISKIRRVYYLNRYVWAEYDDHTAVRMTRQCNRRDGLRLLTDIQNYLYTKIEGSLIMR